jgi:hypothetical protein
MSRSDIPILCLIRYGVVARLQLSRFFWIDTMPRVGCLPDCPICIIVTVTTYALVTFHIERVYTVQHVMGLPRGMLALAARCLAFMYKVAISHHST